MKKVNSRFSLFAIGTLLTGALTIASCDKNDDPDLPPIGGYNNSNEVATASRVAYWTFDGTNNETQANMTPIISVGATFTTGIKGQGLSLNNGYILYPAIAALNNANAINSVTVSTWVKVSNNGKGPTTFMALTQAPGTQNDWNNGPINFMAENGGPATLDDTLVLKGLFKTYIGGQGYGGDNINDYGVREVDFKTLKTGGTWVHAILRYDGSTSTIDLYANGIRVSNNNFRKRTRGTDDMGPIITTPPVHALIGAFPNANCGYANSPVQGWQNFMTGQLDEMRIFTKALTDDEISALYELEKAGR